MFEKTQTPLPLGIFELDGGGQVMAYSTYKSRLQGLARDQVVGKNFFKELVEDEGTAIEGVFRRIYRDRIPFYKVRIKGGKDESRSVLLMFFPDTSSVMVKVDQG